MSKTWFITGAGRGFGQEFAIAALSRGDKVAATVRKPEALQELAERFGDALLPLTMDVTDGESVSAAVHAAATHFGRLDVVVNNAGYGLNGAIEEISEKQLRDQLEVNLFGVLRVTQAVLPIMRDQGAGHIIQISSIGGVTAFPMLGGYHASKWAVEGLSDALSQEVAGFGIKVTLVEPGAYGTDFYGDSATTASALPHYDEVRQATEKMWEEMDPKLMGVVEGVGPAMLKVVDAAEPPLRVFFGAWPVDFVPDAYAKRLETWKAWEAVAMEANGH